MSKSTFALFTLITLAACATPREQCIRDAQGQIRGLNQQVTETQGNISRGFAIQTRREWIEIEVACAIPNGDGTSSAGICPSREWIETNVPVEINLEAEHARLTSLLQQRSRLQNATSVAVQQCIQIHPE